MLDFPRGERDTFCLREDSTISDVVTTFGQLVAKRDYQAALNLWQSAKGEVDEFLYWHNLGLVYRELGNLPQARLAFEKSKLKTIYSSATAHQLELMNEVLPPEGSNESWYDHVNSALINLGPTKVWLLALMLILPFVWLIKASELSRKMITVTLGLCTFPLWFALWFQLSTSAFVLQTPQNVYDGPSKIFQSGKVLPAGLRVMARESNDWWFIIFPPAGVGWLPKHEALRSGELWGME